MFCVHENTRTVLNQWISNVNNMESHINTLLLLLLYRKNAGRKGFMYCNGVCMNAKIVLKNIKIFKQQTF